MATSGRILRLAGASLKTTTMAAAIKANPSGAALSPARIWPPSASRTDVVTPQKGQGTPVIVRIGQGSPQLEGR